LPGRESGVPGHHGCEHDRFWRGPAVPHLDLYLLHVLEAVAERLGATPGRVALA
jgi:hypothetical protein